MRWWQWWRDQIVPQGFTGLLYEDGRFVRVVEPGKHRVRRHWFERVSRTIVPVDVRERSLTIKGQEILTADKVAIRVSLLVYFRVTDPVAASHQVAAYEERIYEDVQLAARRFLSTAQMPGGVPVATMAVGKAGAKNAAIFSAQILSIYDGQIHEKLKRFKASLEEEVTAKDRAIAERLRAK